MNKAKRNRIERKKYNNKNMVVNTSFWETFQDYALEIGFINDSVYDLKQMIFIDKLWKICGKKFLHSIPKTELVSSITNTCFEKVDIDKGYEYIYEVFYNCISIVTYKKSMTFKDYIEMSALIQKSLDIVEDDFIKEHGITALVDKKYNLSYPKMRAIKEFTSGKFYSKYRENLNK